MNGNTDRIHVVLSMEIDDELVEAERERAWAEDPDLTNFYGRPREWGPQTSILDIFDAHKSGAILRTEVVSVKSGPAPWGYEEPSLWRRILAAFGIGGRS